MLRKLFTAALLAYAFGFASSSNAADIVAIDVSNTILADSCGKFPIFGPNPCLGYPNGSLSLTIMPTTGEDFSMINEVHIVAISDGAIYSLGNYGVWKQSTLEEVTAPEALPAYTKAPWETGGIARTIFLENGFYNPDIDFTKRPGTEIWVGVRPRPGVPFLPQNVKKVFTVSAPLNKVP